MVKRRAGLANGAQQLATAVEVVANNLIDGVVALFLVPLAVASSTGTSTATQHVLYGNRRFRLTSFATKSMKDDGKTVYGSIIYFDCLPETLTSAIDGATDTQTTLLSVVLFR